MRSQEQAQPLTTTPGAGWWHTAQVLGLVVTMILIAGFFVRPDPALNTLWNILIPLVPASLLVSPGLWRNVCPLATLNMIANGAVTKRSLIRGAAPAAGAAGMLLLIVLVPARRFLFNTNGIALAIVVIAVAVAALVLGTLFDMKAGFCNAVCPVLPVERLYGHHPMMNLPNVRCPTCTLCTATGCIDLGPVKSVAQTLGPARRSHAWLGRAFGVFAAAFPGFVIGYYTTQDGPLSQAGAVYIHVLFWMIGSYVVVSLVIRALKLSSGLSLTLLAATAAALYYWYAGPLVAEGVRITAATWPIRIGAWLVVAWWLWRAVGRMQNGRVEDTAPA